MTARRAAVAALLRIHEQGGYSNVLLEELLEETTLAAADRALATRLLYGVVERRLTLDYLLNKTASTPVKEMHPTLREILRVGAYQLVYMDKTPAFASINESVELTRGMGLSRLTGFTNGVLRRIEREWPSLLEALPQTDKGLEIRYSCPRAWIRTWRQSYGEDALFGLLESLNEAPPTFIRVNTCLTSVSSFAETLMAAKVDFHPVSGLPEAFRVSPAALRRLPDEEQRAFYFQDLASQWCCAALAPLPGERVADVCAAPGGKTMTVAQMMDDTGLVLAGDIYPQKCDTLRRRAKKHGLTCIHVIERDAATPPDTSLAGTFDRVLCDAPCSGLGVIRRKPEIRYKSPEDFADLPQLQLRILSQAAALVRPGGVLQYSTCTLRPEENEQVAAAFLAAHPDFMPRELPVAPLFEAAGQPVGSMLTLFPHIHGTDGFFVAGFQKR